MHLNILLFATALSYNITYPTVHRNKQRYKLASWQYEKLAQTVETIMKDQLTTEYEFYEYAKQRLAGQTKTLAFCSENNQDVTDKSCNMLIV